MPTSKRKKKKKTNRLFLITIIILGSLTGIFTYLNLSKTTAEDPYSDEVSFNEIPSANELPADAVEEKLVTGVDWTALTSEIKGVIESEFPDRTLRTGDVGLYKQGDITGDGTPEALIKISCGATTCELVLLKIKNGEPTVPYFKKEDGDVSPLIFTSGGGGAGRYGSGTELEESESAISFNYFYIYGGEDDICSSDVYQWSPENELFQYSPSLSIEKTKKYCEGHPCETALLLDSGSLMEFCLDL